MSAPSALPSGNRRSEDRWLERGRELALRLSAPRWEIGDWWLSGDRPGLRIEDVAGRTGLAPATIWNCGWLARAFPPARRRAALSHSHHAEVAGLPPAVADRLLDRAAADGWPVARIRAAARAAARREEVEAERAAAQLGLDLEPNAVAWRTDLRRVERECRERLTTAEALVRTVVDAVEALASHPGADRVHGNRRRAAAERLRGILAPDGAGETGIDLAPRVQPLLERIRSRS